MTDKINFDLKEYLDQKFGSIDKRFDKIECRLDNIEKDLSEHRVREAVIETKVNIMIAISSVCGSALVVGLVKYLFF